MGKYLTYERVFKFFLGVLYLGTAAVIIYFFIDGFDYYRMPYHLRIRHPEYANLKPGGFRSHGLGILGSTMMLLLLLYSLRKRTRIFGNWGKMSHWLNIHIYFGIMGPLFVILHTTFKLNGLIAISFWSMIAVALSGVIGRYLYVQIPRNIHGVELTLEQAKKIAEQQKQTLTLQYGLDENEIELLKSMVGKPFKGNSLFAAFFAFIFTDLRFIFRRHAIHKRIKQRFDLPAKKVRILTHLFIKEIKLERRIQFWNQIHQIFHYWHVIHKPFAIIMYLIMFIHVAIAIWLGYTWI